MRSWSIPVFSIFGVQVRLHLFFLLLLGVSLAYVNYRGISSARGVVLWFILLLAVLVREGARGLVALRGGLELRHVLLLPIGGLLTHATSKSNEAAGEKRLQARLAAAGISANIAAALVIGGIIVSVAPQVSMFAKPWITPEHLLRSFVWINLLLAGINLLPAYPTDAGQLLRKGMARNRPGVAATRAASSLSQIMALISFCAGLVFLNLWLIFGGIFLYLASHLEDQGVFFQAVVDTIYMRDIMLRDFTTLSPAHTLEQALEHALHSLQDDFPVVRGDRMVGIISRRNMLDAIASGGNNYVQSAMDKTFRVARPEDSIGDTFRRIAGGRGLSLVPILQGDRVVGIVTLQNMMHSMSTLAESRRVASQSRG